MKASFADLILRNGRIYTVDRARSWASAVAILNGRYVAVGDDAAVERYRGPATAIVDLQGRMAMPGITDIHTHMRRGSTAARQARSRPLDRRRPMGHRQAAVAQYRGRACQARRGRARPSGAVA